MTRTLRRVLMLGGALKTGFPFYSSLRKREDFIVGSYSQVLRFPSRGQGRGWGPGRVDTCIKILRKHYIWKKINCRLQDREPEEHKKQLYKLAETSLLHQRAWPPREERCFLELDVCVAHSLACIPESVYSSPFPSTQLDPLTAL